MTDENMYWGMFKVILRKIYNMPTKLMIAFKILTFSNYVVILSNRRGSKTRTQLGGIYITEPLIVIQALRSVVDGLARFYRGEVPEDQMTEEVKSMDDASLEKLLNEIYRGRV